MSKIIIYQLLPRLFGNLNTNRIKNGSIVENGCGKFEDISTKALKAIRNLGATHIWYTGVIEHATKTDYSSFGIKKDHPSIVKGTAGSAYAIKDYYDVDPDLASKVSDRLKEFKKLVDRTHKAGLKVIMDFVPNHVARQYHSNAKPKGVIDLGENDCQDWHFSPLNNFYYFPGQPLQPDFDVKDYVEFPARATGNDVFSAYPQFNDWYETIKLNYGVNYTEGMQKQFDPIPDTWLKMRDILLYWADFEVDAFRCDMAELVPVEFWHWVIQEVKGKFPEILFIAEVYQPNKYRDYIHYGGFDYLYDKVGMYDLLRNIVCYGDSASKITSQWQSTDDISNHLLHFLENHDEQRIASDFFAGDALKAYPAAIVSATLTKAPFMLYSGQELGEKGMEEEGYSGKDGRTTIFDYWGIDSIQRWINQGEFDGGLLAENESNIRNLYVQLLNMAKSTKAISEGEMYDLQYANFGNENYDTDKIFSYIRKSGDEIVLITVNFDNQPNEIRLRIPDEALSYLELRKNQTYKLVDLLGAESVQTEWTSGMELKIKIPPYSGRILNFFKLT